MRALMLLSLLAGLAAADDSTFWGIALDKDFTVHDSLPVSCNLFYRSDHAPATDPAFYPEVELLAAGKAPLRKQLDATVVPYPSRSLDPQPDAIAWSGRFDLRAVFGKLPAGKYAFRVRGPGGVASEDAAFEIVEARIEDARKAAKAGGSVELRVEAEAGADGRIGVVTNRSRETMVFYGYANEGAVVEPVGSIARSERWHPVRGWRSEPFGICGTGLRSVELAPGATLRILLMPAEDGIVRWVLELRPKGQEREQPVCAVSAPILVAAPAPPK
ncbi:MAG: hypothetical protein ACT4PV_10435 [Planctomycetaceae bacterium]